MTSVVVIAIAIVFVTVAYFILRKGNHKVERPESHPKPAENAIFIKLQDINQRIEYLMHTKKVYLDPTLRSSKLAEMVGTNRTYLLKTLHYFHGTGYINYVNHFRFDELKELLYSVNQCPEEELCQLCGFPTVETMIRLVKMYSGMQFKDFLRATKSKYLNSVAQLEVAEETKKPN